MSELEKIEMLEERINLKNKKNQQFTTVKYTRKIQE